MASTQTLKTSERIDQARKFMVDFYHKPIAQVSSELFFTIIAIIFFASFAIQPTIITMTELVKEIRDKEEVVGLLTRKVTALSTVQNEYFSLQNKFFLLDETIPEQPNFREVLAVIEKESSQQQLGITSLQLREVPLGAVDATTFQQKEPIQLNVTMVAQGSFGQIQQFMENVTSLRPLFTVDGVTISKGGLESSTDIVNATIRLEVHYYAKSQPKTEENSPEAAPESVL